jgi:hypothetical protein
MVECLPSKHEALSTNGSTAKKRKRKRKKTYINLGPMGSHCQHDITCYIVQESKIDGLMRKKNEADVQREDKMRAGIPD